MSYGALAAPLDDAPRAVKYSFSAISECTCACTQRPSVPDLAKASEVRSSLATPRGVMLSVRVWPMSVHIQQVAGEQGVEMNTDEASPHGLHTV